MRKVSFFDLEIDPAGKSILDVGCVRWDDAMFHENSVHKFRDFVSTSDFIAGHNVLNHDLKYVHQYLGEPSFGSLNTIDTLYLSPLLFPSKPYHHLLKDDKLHVEERNNPLNDSLKAKDLFYDEVRAFQRLDHDLKKIFFNLLADQKEFACFFEYIDYSARLSPEECEILIRSFLPGKFCAHAPLGRFIQEAPVALAYSIALIYCNDKYSITPPWVLHHFPDVERVLFLLRGRPCVTGCAYCNEALDPYRAMKRLFGFDRFRSYADEPLQENAVKAAIQGKSLLAVFPTGGGKSITFQLPALMSGENTKALTVVISPLQSLMKDQVDNLEKKSITDAVAINGLLDPIERSEAINRVSEGGANLLYISPESLRSVTIERLLLGRKIARFVIDEAHCFSAWGQDFRVDYLYIGDFIKNLQEKKGTQEKIPVSCFTATAKQKVIEDIRSYFRDKLDIDLEVFRSDASRTNLHYKVFNKDGEEEKYAEARRLLEAKKCPAIIYVSRTKRAYQLAERLTKDGFNARPYHGKMDRDEKTANQTAFIEGSVDVMVATSAFGMGVDKSDVGMVIHFDISDSLENYVQEAGRAGRDESITADCYVLFNEADLDKHFILLNQTKLGIKEINQVWKAIKELTRTRDRVSNSALEIARKAGWDDSIAEIETRVTTAIAALEEAGYVKRGQNSPQLFANSILANSAQEAILKINASEKFTAEQKVKAARIIKKLFSSKSKRLATEEAAESRVDYISDHLGIVKEEVIRIVQLLRDEKILADAKDLTAFIKKGENSNRSLAVLEKFRELECFFLSSLSDEESTYNVKELNEKALAGGCKGATPNSLRTLMNFWVIKNWVRRKNHEHSRNHVQMVPLQSRKALEEKMHTRHQLSKIIVEYLYGKALKLSDAVTDEILIEFSVQELKEEAQRQSGIFQSNATNDDIEDSLFYLSRIEAIKIEGGFLVVYNKLTVNRLEMNNKIQYKQEDYQKLAQFYQNKVQQIHIVGEYAKKMVENYNEALQFVDDYFTLNYSSFLAKYFPGSRQDDIRRPLTPEKFRQLFGSLSPAQLEIIKDSANQYIVVAAGPGSGKTRVLVHKLASLLLAEDVKHEQLLMLTFSRAAATEFKKRLIDLIGNAAHYVEIKTFHSYCFDILGKMGTIGESDSVLELAVEGIRNKNIEPSRITKAVLVIDEAQDMSAEEFELVKELMERNDGMRVLLVGDDDQNIYEFRGSDSKHMVNFITANGAKKYEMVENYRSRANLVAFSNQWVKGIPGRLKHTPIVAHNTADGRIVVTEHPGGNLVTAAVESIQKTGLAGSTCVLTRTNEEAVQITGLLIKNGRPARLIQTNDGFKLYDLSELRYFSDLVLEDNESAVISDDEWTAAKAKFNQAFRQSSNLEWSNLVIREFEATNRYRRYKSDWKTFLAESKFEDFVQADSETICVSTIHKAKGREFDNVFLVLDNFNARNPECMRQFYVAVTRAKSNLAVHYNGSYLRNIIVNGLIYSTARFYYPDPPSIALLLTHRDVQLGYFEFVQHRMNGLTGGSSLSITEEGLAAAGGLALKFSKEFAKVIEQLRQKGYRLTAAKINFIVYWHDKNIGREVKIILPEVELSK